MGYETIIYEKEDKIATLWFNRPEVRNVWSAQMAMELVSALKEIDADPEVLVVILTGKGDKAFSAGADISNPRTHTLESVADSIEAALRIVPKVLFDTLSEFPKPIIAAINGYAAGQGLRVALSCDILVASENAKMSLPEVSLGLIPNYGGALRLARFVGKGKAMEMILTSGWIDAQDAYRVGLVSRVVPQPELMPTAREIATRIASFPPISVRLAKQSLNEALDIGALEAASQADIFRQLLLYQTEDRKEAHEAWREKRQPHFRGR